MKFIKKAAKKTAATSEVAGDAPQDDGGPELEPEIIEKRKSLRLGSKQESASVVDLVKRPKKVAFEEQEENPVVKRKKRDIKPVTGSMANPEFAEITKESEGANWRKLLDKTSLTPMEMM